MQSTKGTLNLTFIYLKKLKLNIRMAWERKNVKALLRVKTIKSIGLKVTPHASPLASHPKSANRFASGKDKQYVKKYLSNWTMEFYLKVYLR